MSNSQITTLDSQAPRESEKGKRDAKKVSGANHDVALCGDKAIVTIHPTDGDGGSDAVFLSINGYAYQIPRGEPQEVPVEVLEILKNAQTTTYRADTRTGDVTERTVPRYAYTVH
jgi:hypothetical protein